MYNFNLKPTVGCCTIRHLVPHLHCILDAYTLTTPNLYTQNKGVVMGQHPTQTLIKESIWQ